MPKNKLFSVCSEEKKERRERRNFSKFSISHAAAQVGELCYRRMSTVIQLSELCIENLQILVLNDLVFRRYCQILRCKSLRSVLRNMPLFNYELILITQLSTKKMLLVK